MSKSNDPAGATATGGTPAGGTPPRVHHQGATGQQSAAAGQRPAYQITPEDYQNPLIADFMVRPLPPQIVFVKGQPEAAPTAQQTAPPPVETADQAARAAGDAIYTGLTTKPQTFWESIATAIRLRFLADGIDPRNVRVSLPFNSTQVLAGGMSVIKAVQTNKKAECMEVDITQMAQDMALALRAGEAKEALSPLLRVADATETVALNQVADKVDAGLTVGESVIDADGNLSWVLGPALAIRGNPASDAVATRAENARSEAQIRADEQQKLQAGGSQPPPQTTTTVTTQSAAQEGTPQVAVPAAAAALHKKK